MRVAYLTTDEVNQALAQEMAEPLGLKLDVISPRDPAPDGEFGAVLYDLDYLPARLRTPILAALASGSESRVVAVHGYDLEDDQAESLRQKGVIVSRRLEAEVFMLLSQANDCSIARAGR